MKRGTCKFCLQEKDLIRSHLLPRAVYDLCRAPDSEPVRITQKVVMQTSRQTQDYLLCSQCDNHLSKCGENWVLPRLKTWSDGFPLYDILEKIPPDAVISEGKAYSASRNPEIDGDAITHFAVGIFWKASVHSWRKDKIEPRIDLGPYSDKLRTFLRGETPFPDHVMLNVGVVPPNLTFTNSVEPYRGRAKVPKNYVFVVPGIQFVLTIGKTIDPEVKQTCFCRSPFHPIIVTDLATPLYEIYREVTAKAHRSRKLVEYIEKRKAETKSAT